MAYVKNDICSGVKVFKQGPDEMIWLILDKHFFNMEKDLALCVCYKVPENSSYEPHVSRDVLDVIVEDMAVLDEKYGCDFIVCGDLNGRTGTEPDYVTDDISHHLPLPDFYVEDFNDLPTRYNQDEKVNASGRKILEMCRMANLRIANGRIGKDTGKGSTTCTRYNGCSTVDYVLCSPNCVKNLMNDLCVLPQHEFSDHNLITMEIGVRYTIVDVQCRSYQKMVWDNDKCDEYVHTLNSNDCVSKLNEMAHLIENSDPNETTVNEAVNICVEALRMAADPLFLKHKKASSYINTTDAAKNLPDWADDDWSQKRKHFYKQRDKFNRMPTAENRCHMVDARSAYKSASWRCMQTHRNAQTAKLLHAKVKNVKLYWKMLSGTKNVNRPMVSTGDFYNHFLRLSNPDNEFYTADEDIVNELNEMIDGELQVMFDELNVAIEPEEISRAIKDLKNGKSGGEDLLLNEFFIHGKDLLSPYLLKLFNFIFSSGIFPTFWSDGLLVPLHKKGSQTDPGNYRGITLLSTMGKLFTRVINSRLDNWAEQYAIYVEAQYGFRKGRSTTDCIFVLHNIINNFVESGKKLYAFFIDYSKAFDYVVRENLWYKLMQCGVSGKMLMIIKSMYSHIKTKIFIGGEKSEAFECKLGVRQGECLSPFLFAVYINDLEISLSDVDAGVTINDLKILVLFYADDVVIFSETATGLQNEIDKLLQYCSRWKLKLNTDKSQVVVFRRGNQPVKESWYFGDTKLIVTNKIPYLGLLLTSNGLFHQTQLTLAAQANKAVFLLYRRLQGFINLKPEFMLDLFDKFITPVLNYGCEVWGFHQAPSIENVHLKFCKNILGVKKSTQNDFVYGELGRTPMQIIRYVRIIKYWLNIVTGKKSQYVCLVYAASVQQIGMNKKHNWAESVKSLLFHSGFSEVWYNQGVADIDAFVKVFKVRITDIFKQEWRGRIENSTRARFYRFVRPNHQFNKYLNVVIPRAHRVALTRLIVSSHTLHVENGRWKRPVIPYEQRYCHKCINKLEDEYHMLLECELYNDIRQQLIPRYYWTRPSMQKLLELICNERNKVIKAISKFVFCAFKIRNDSLL